MRGFEQVMYAALALIISAIVAYIFISNTNLPTYSVSKPIESMKTSFELVDYGIVYPNTLVIYLRPTSPVNISNVIVYINRQKAIVKKIGNTPGDIVDPNKGDLIMVSLDNFQGNDVNLFVSGVNILSRSFSINLEGKKPIMPTNITRYFYRIPIIIQERSGNNLINYQVNITINTQALISAGKMKSDCGDIRFTDTNGNPLNYWIESGCNTNSTRIWVRASHIPANSNVTIYMYYGNPSATSQSNSTAAFGKNVSFYYARDNYYIAFILANREWVSGGTNLGITGDDSGASRTLPFPVVIYGTNVTAVYLSTNGLLRWDNVADTRYSNTLDTARKILTAHWDDLYISTSYRSDAGIYEIIGSDSIGQYVAYRWATTYYVSRSTPADFEILLYVNGYIQFNVYGVWSGATPNEFISRGDGANYIDLTPRWQYMESVLFVPRAYPEPSVSLGNEEITFYYPS